MAHTEKCRGCRNENKCDYIRCTNETEKQIRNRAIDEFAGKMITMMPGHRQDIEKIAEQMKG